MICTNREKSRIHWAKNQIESGELYVCTKNPHYLLKSEWLWQISSILALSLWLTSCSPKNQPSTLGFRQMSHIARTRSQPNIVYHYDPSLSIGSPVMLPAESMTGGPWAQSHARHRPCTTCVFLLITLVLIVPYITLSYRHEIHIVKLLPCSHFANTEYWVGAVDPAAHSNSQNMVTVHFTQ